MYKFAHRYYQRVANSLLLTDARHCTFPGGRTTVKATLRIKTDATPPIRHLFNNLGVIRALRPIPSPVTAHNSGVNVVTTFLSLPFCIYEIYTES
jgi:hypothetical protein